MDRFITLNVDRRAKPYTLADTIPFTTVLVPLGPLTYQRAIACTILEELGLTIQAVPPDFLHREEYKEGLIGQGDRMFIDVLAADPTDLLMKDYISIAMGRLTGTITTDAERLEDNHWLRRDIVKHEDGRQYVSVTYEPVGTIGLVWWMFSALYLKKILPNLIITPTIANKYQINELIYNLDTNSSTDHTTLHLASVIEMASANYLNQVNATCINNDYNQATDLWQQLKTSCLTLCKYSLQEYLKYHLAAKLPVTSTAQNILFTYIHGC